LRKDLIIRSVRNMEITHLVQQEVKAALRLSLWLLVPLLLAAVFVGIDPAATWGLFQSPPPTTTQSPLPTDTVPPPTEIPALTPTEIVTPTQAPIVTATAILTPTFAPTEIPPTATTAPPVPTATLAPSVTPAVSVPEATTEESQRYPTEDANLKFDWGMLFDSVALGASYVWICCGVLLLVLVPVFSIVLWVANKRRQQDKDQQQQG
jgi:hypothetical protein